MNARYTVNFHFEDDSVSVLEIKRNLIVETDKSKLYKWLVFDKKNGSLSPLTFVSMDTKDGKEYRTFKEAKLEFDNRAAIFRENDKEFRLKVIKEKKLPAEINEMIGDYLLSLNFK